MEDLNIISYQRSEYFKELCYDKNLKLGEYFDKFINHADYPAPFEKIKNMFSTYAYSDVVKLGNYNFSISTIEIGNLNAILNPQRCYSGVFDYHSFFFSSKFSINFKEIIRLIFRTEHYGNGIVELGVYVPELNNLHLCDLTHLKYFAKPIVKRILIELKKRKLLNKVD